MLRVVILYLLAVNILAYVIYWLDKRRAAKGGRRISERELLGWALVGGSIGSFLAMRRFRHKTEKLSFRLAFLGVVILQVAGIWLVAARPWEH